LVVAVGAATIARWLLAQLVPQLTYVTYYPAVLIACLLTGWRWGSASAVLSGLVALTLFHDPNIEIIQFHSIAGFLAFLFSASIIIVTANTLRKTLRDLERAREEAAMLNHELQHRVGNLLTVVQAMAVQSARRSKPEEFVEAFSGRLKTLSKAHNLLGRQDLQHCNVAALADEACQPFCCDDNIVKAGPQCCIPPQSCVPLMLALHELCTNAVKYGALSVPEGRVHISWRCERDSRKVVLSWAEQNGPLVTPPNRTGLGSALLRAQNGIAAVDLQFPRDGARCAIVIDGATCVEPSSDAPVTGQPA